MYDVVAERVQRSGVPRATIVRDDPGLTDALPATALLAGCREHWVIASTRPRALPNPPTAVLTPERPLAAGIDPAQWGLVTAPTLHVGSDDAAKWC